MPQPLSKRRLYFCPELRIINYKHIKLQRKFLCSMNLVYSTLKDCRTERFKDVRRRLYCSLFLPYKEYVGSGAVWITPCGGPTPWSTIRLQPLPEAVVVGLQYRLF